MAIEKQYTIASALASATKALNSRSDSARLDAELLLSDALGKARSWLYAHPHDALTPAQLEQYNAAVQARCAGAPIAYLRGEQEFWSLSFCVNEAVLIPRADTELLVELALRSQNGKRARVLELGTGSGCISVALASERPDWIITATDNSLPALAVARTNAINAGVSQQIQWVCCDWFSAIKPQRFELIISNPPYIRNTDPHLQQGDLPAEPLSALAAGSDGMDAFRAIIPDATCYLGNGGKLLLEHGHDQADLVRQLLISHGYSEVMTHLDLGERERVTVGRTCGVADADT